MPRPDHEHGRGLDGVLAVPHLAPIEAPVVRVQMSDPEPGFDAPAGPLKAPDDHPVRFFLQEGVVFVPPKAARGRVAVGLAPELDRLPGVFCYVLKRAKNAQPI